MAGQEDIRTDAGQGGRNLSRVTLPATAVHQTWIVAVSQSIVGICNIQIMPQYYLVKVPGYRP
jgi:hypothetical protein